MSDFKDTNFQNQNSSDEEGQLAIDAFETEEELVILAPIAGVDLSDITLEITDDVLTIKGERANSFKDAGQQYLTQECFWGAFSRSIILPKNTNTKKISAEFNKGVLTIKIPKVEEESTRIIKIKPTK